jgi:hypothetical protein
LITADGLDAKSDASCGPEAGVSSLVVDLIIEATIRRICSFTWLTHAKHVIQSLTVSAPFSLPHLWRTLFPAIAEKLPISKIVLTIF